MNDIDLYAEIQKTRKLMHLALAESKQRGLTHADTERTYRIALAQQMLTERANKTPTTIINDVCRGTLHIADLKFDRDVAEVKYKAASEAINIYKKEINFLEDQLNREWSQCK